MEAFNLNYMIFLCASYILLLADLLELLSVKAFQMLILQTTLICRRSTIPCRITFFPDNRL